MSEQHTLPEKEQIVHEILEYLCDHPGAQDTLEGIMQWWLLERRIHQHTAFVKEALQSLEDRQYIKVENVFPEGPFYRINERHIDEICSSMQRHQGRMTMT